MRQLGIPYQFVGVQGFVCIASLTVHVAIGREIRAPWERYLRVAAILEIPCCQVVRSLQAVVCTCVGRTSVQREAEPPVTETERYRWIDVVGMRDVTVRRGRTVQVDIAHAVRIAGIDRARDVPSVQGVQSDREAHAEVSIPVAVDVLWS